ncbi:hypothetical protein [Micromonospora sp. KC213]|uniref:hypothetical protein n=1 Tax=Micromonospora sp. KC213 TaxID=2530378 RepID=UPI00104EC1AC|nr:hypothetical protein [Micromonospora sp. KC213]TDC33578.1 hypothetical protein E1166_25515 [Micromonospora sp. KC213]
MLTGPVKATAAPAAAPAGATEGSSTTPTIVDSPTRRATATVRPTRPRPVVGCAGPLRFGEVKSCPSIRAAQEHVWTVTSAVDQDTLLARLDRVSGDSVGARVTDSAGDTVCFLGPYLDECRLGAAGTYLVTVSLSHRSGEGAYTLSVESTRGPSKCVSLPNEVFSFAFPGHRGTLPAGLSAACFTFDQPTGTLLLSARPNGTGDLRGSILDADHQLLCSVDYGGQCKLSRPGPYRLFIHELYGNESTYTLKLPRLSHPVGCPTVPLTTFGDPGPAVGTGSLERDAVGCHAVEATAPGPVVVRFNQYANQYLWWTMYDVDGNEVCHEGEAAHSCSLPAAGTYTLLTRSQHWDPVPYQVAVTSLRGMAGCAATTGTNWDQPTLLVHQTSALQTNCQPFQGEAGDRIVVYRAPVVYNELAAWLVDEQGTVLCTEPSEEDGCLLPTSGTFRVISHLAYWKAGDTDLTYQMQVRRLSAPVGCPGITPGAYNTSPAGALGNIRCRTLNIAAAGTYRVKAVDTENFRRYGTVYDSSGRELCRDMWCELPAAGQYTLVLEGGAVNSVIGDDFRYAVALLPWTPSSCPTVSDTGWRDAPHRGAFTAAGQYNCLQLASPAGSRVVELLPGDAGAGAPEVTVMDSTGKYVCDSSWGLRQYHCELTGEAPFFAVLNARDDAAPGPYALAFARTDGPPTCPTLSAGTEGSTVATGADRFAVCFSIPADQRAARESISYQRATGTGDARLSVFDSQGTRYCGPTRDAVARTIACAVPAGTVTVMLEADAVEATYQFTHRDAGVPST